MSVVASKGFGQCRHRPSSRLIFESRDPVHLLYLLVVWCRDTAKELWCNLSWFVESASRPLRNMYRQESAYHAVEGINASKVYAADTEIVPI